MTAKEKFYIVDDVIYEDEPFSNPNWQQPIDHPTTFATPTYIAEENIEALGVSKNHTVLECSCGPGEYLYHVSHAKHVDAVELHQEIIDLCPQFENTTLHNQDFLTYTTSNLYDRIICSPPLKEYAENGESLSFAILKHSWPMLKSGGVMLLNLKKGTEAEFFDWLEANDGKVIKTISRPYHKWHDLFQNAAIITKQ